MAFDTSNSIHRLIIRIYASLVVVLCADVLAESKVYRYVDENSVVSFSSKPPANETEAEQVDVPGGNIIASETLPEESKKEIKKINKRVNRFLAEKKAREQEITKAKNEVKNRKEALEKGKIPLPGERKGTVFGYSRLLPSYFDRVEHLEEQLAIAENRLKALQDKYQQ